MSSHPFVSATQFFYLLVYNIEEFCPTSPVFVFIPIFDHPLWSVRPTAWKPSPAAGFIRQEVWAWKAMKGKH